MFLRSEQNTLDTTDGKAKGIPGALSNTPPMAAELKSSLRQQQQVKMF